MKVTVEFEVELPALNGVTVTWDEIDSWIKYGIGALNSISIKNPLVDMKIEADSNSVCWSEL